MEELITSSQQNVLEEKEHLEEENMFTSSNYQNEKIEKEETIQSKDEAKNCVKKGEFFFTPIESIFLNKLMPPGFKFELEENMLKLFDSPNNKKRRRSQINNNFENFSNFSNYKTKKIQINLTKSKRNSLDNSSNHIIDTSKIAKKCKIGFEKVKNSPWISCFYEAKKPNEPCLSTIEKKINNYEYRSFYDFAMDVRKIWYYFFNKSYQNNNDIYDKTSKISELWENIVYELENTKDDIGDIAMNVKKRNGKYNTNYNGYKSIYTNDPLPPKIAHQNYDDKPMTIEEKNKLGILIRSLNKEKLKGIMKIISDENTLVNSKYCEFDIGKLSNKKLRELEKYTKKCLLVNGSENNTKNQQENQINQVNKNISDININNKALNKNNVSMENNLTHKETNELSANDESKYCGKKMKEMIGNNDNKSESISESVSISSDSS